MSSIATRGSIVTGTATGAAAAIAALGLVALALTGDPRPADASGAGHAGEAAAAGQPYVVKVHADWCGTCRMLEPTWKRIENELADDARIVVLDVTDREAVAASRKQAERLGLTRFFDRYKSQTGTIGVLDGDREPVKVMKGTLEFAEYERAVAKAAGRS